jgi:hypothetical protein
MKTFKFKQEETIECVMTTLFEVEAKSLSQAKKLTSEYHQVGVMFTEAVVLEEGDIEYVKDK